MFKDHRHQEEWEAIWPAVEVAARMVAVTIFWFGFALLIIIIHHYGR